MYRILVVDDDPLFRTALRNALEVDAHEITDARNGKDAIEILSKSKPFDFIFSDIRMPEMDGLQFLKVAKKMVEVPFILMTAFSDAEIVQTAHEAGADYFLPKPFFRKDLLDAMRGALKNFSKNALDPGEAIEGLMCKIPVDEFIFGSQIPFPIYVRFRDAKFVKFANHGEDLDTARIKMLKAKGLTHLYMKDDDYIKYTGMILEIAKASENSTETKARRLELLGYMGGLLEEQLQLRELTSETKLQLATFISDTMSILTRSDSLLDVFFGMIDNSQNSFKNGLNTAICALLICKGLKWDALATKSRVLLAALLHDIGEKEIPQEILEKGRGDLTFEERKIYESHTIRGFDILSSIPAIPREIAQVALQHHEDCLGYGYPMGLKKAQISSMAKLIAISSEFCERIRSAMSFQKGPVSGLEILALLAKEKGELFEKDYLVALRLSLSPPSVGSSG